MTKSSQLFRLISMFAIGNSLQHYRSSSYGRVVQLIIICRFTELLFGLVKVKTSLDLPVIIVSVAASLSGTQGEYSLVSRQHLQSRHAVDQHHDHVRSDKRPGEAHSGLDDLDP